MKSDVIHVSSRGAGAGLSEALEQVEAVAAFKKLNPKETIRLRLLAEEMVGMLSAVTGEMEADFWIEDNKKDFSLHLVTSTFMNTMKREKILSVSSSGRNSAASGVMGKIWDLFTRAFEPLDDDIEGAYTAGWMISAMDRAETPTMAAAPVWSFNQYRQSLLDANPDNREEWDELEKSIVANLADEVKIFIEDRKVELVIYKKF